MTAFLRTRLKELAAEHRRFGYRRVRNLFRRDDVTVNHKWLYREEEKLQVRRGGGRKAWPGTGVPLVIPRSANRRWSLDFVSDQLGLRPALPDFDGDGRLHQGPERLNCVRNQLSHWMRPRSQVTLVQLRLAELTQD